MKNVTVPTIDQLSPALAELQAKRLALGNEAAALRAERYDLSLAEPQPDSGDHSQAVRVAALLGAAPPQKLPSSTERVRWIDGRLRDIEAACMVLDGQMQTEKGRASVKAQELLADEFKARRRAVCEALVAVHSADFRLRALVEEIESRGLSAGGWNQVFPYRLDSPRDPHGWPAQYLEQARRDGIIGRSVIPSELSP